MTVTNGANRWGSKTFAVLAALALVALGTVFSVQGVAADGPTTVDFEPTAYATGEPGGQHGWTHSGTYDYEIVPNGTAAAVPAEFGSQSLRVSNAIASGSFDDHLFSAPLAEEAGETSAEDTDLSDGPRQNHFSAEWDFTSAAPEAEQAGLKIGIAPTRGDIARMSYIELLDESAGLTVRFWEVDGTTDPVTFVSHDVATGLDRGDLHTVRLDMTFVDGPSNDIVKVYVNNGLVHTGTSWENYFRFDTEALGISPEAKTQTVDSLLFIARGSNVDGVADKGFLIDNLTLQSSTVTIGTPPPSGGGGGGGGSSSDDEPVTEGTIEDNDLEVEVEAGETAEVESGEDTVVGTESEDGSTVEVTAPEGALPEGGSLSTWAIADLEGALAEAPAPEGADIVLGFVVQATDEDGDPVDGPFDPPLELEFTVPADQLPDGASVDRVTLVFWDGEEWVEVEATVVVNADGSLSLSASVDHLTVFAVAIEENTGTFEPAPAASGVSLTSWGGGTFADLDAALQPGASVWVFVDGVAYGYTVGSPDFVNARFASLYPGGVPAGTLMIVAI